MRRTKADSTPAGGLSRPSGAPIPGGSTRTATLAFLAPLAAVAALALAVPASAQEPVGEPEEQEARARHQVVRGNTLWELAESFYGNPYLWPRIWEANRDRIEDPHWIYPGQVLRIPGEGGELVEVTVAAGEPAEGDMRPARVARDGRSIFYPGGGRAGAGTILPRTAFYPRNTEIDLVVGAERRQRLAFSHSSYYSAEWLSRIEEEAVPAHVGRLSGFSGAEGEITERVTARPFERLQVTLAPGEQVAVGDLLQTFRVARHEEVGAILRPTGMIVVTDIDPAGAVATVSASFDRILIGDLVRPAPAFPLVPGVAAEPVESASTARVIAVGQERAIQSPRDVLILNVGSRDGVRVGDEYVYVSSEPGWSGEIEGVVQVVGVRPTSASARISDLDQPVFEVGSLLRLAGRMP